VPYNINVLPKITSSDPLYIRHVYYPHRSDIQQLAAHFSTPLTLQASHLFNRLIKMKATQVFLLLAFMVLLSSISLPIYILQLYINNLLHALGSII